MERTTRVVINEDGDLEYVPVRGFKLTDEDRISIVWDFVEQRMSPEEQLEQSLRLERLRSEAFSTMIDIAEQEFNIPIRKKSDNKQ